MLFSLFNKTVFRWSSGSTFWKLFSKKHDFWTPQRFYRSPNPPTPTGCLGVLHKLGSVNSMPIREFTSLTLQTPSVKSKRHPKSMENRRKERRKVYLNRRIFARVAALRSPKKQENARNKRILKPTEKCIFAYVSSEIAKSYGQTYT